MTQVEPDPTSPLKRRCKLFRRRRGYILLETVVSGVITATAVLGLLGQLSSARIAGIAAAREQTASRLAAGEIEGARARAATIMSGTLRQERVLVGNGGYNVITIADPVQFDELPARGTLVLRPAYVNVHTEVTFDVANTQRHIAASTRLYR